MPHNIYAMSPFWQFQCLVIRSLIQVINSDIMCFILQKNLNSSALTFVSYRYIMDATRHLHAYPLSNGGCFKVPIIIMVIPPVTALPHALLNTRNVIHF